MRTKKITISIALLVIGYYTYVNFMFDSEIIGVYKNYNFKTENVIFEECQSNDVLVLSEKDSFRSYCHARGVFKIKRDYKGTYIEMSCYNYGLNYKIERTLFNKKRIIVNRNENYYYEKQ